MSTRTPVPPGLGPPPATPPGAGLPPAPPPAAPAPGGRAGGREGSEDTTGRTLRHFDLTRRRSLATRVTLLTTMAVGLAVVIMAAGAYLTTRAQMQHETDQSLLERAHSAAQAGVLASLPQTLPAQRAVVAPALGAADVNITIVYASGALYPLGPTFPISGPELAVARGQSAQSVRTVVYKGVRYRVVAVPANVPGQALVFAKPLTEQDDVLTHLGLVSLFFGLGGMILAAVAGWGVARSGLRPVRRLTASVEDIARTEDLTPLPVEGDDEVARLATAFNQMLTSLDASRERQRRLVADAGHELRTPLTSLRTNIDLLTQVSQAGLTLEPTARDELLADIAAQIDELTTLIGDLTELARDEPLPPVVGSVDLAELVDVAVSRVRRRAPGVTFDVETHPWEVFGEAPALERAVTNLLDNAAKWSPPDGTVTVRLVEGVLTVDDQGPGIAPADRARVFDRFWRAEESRTMPGSGLGLSIVRQAVERHAGTVTAEEAPGGGARLVLRIPGVPEPARA